MTLLFGIRCPSTKLGHEGTHHRRRGHQSASIEHFHLSQRFEQLLFPKAGLLRSRMYMGYRYAILRAELLRFEPEFITACVHEPVSIEGELGHNVIGSQQVT